MLLEGLVIDLRKRLKINNVINKNTSYGVFIFICEILRWCFTRQRKPRHLANKSRKKENVIIPISKEIAHRLNKECGVPWKDYGISTNFCKGKRKKYYLCPLKKNLVALAALNKD